MELQTEAAWCAKALSHCQHRDPERLCNALLEVLQAMKDAELSSYQRCDHPSTVLMAAQLAELMGLFFFWPSDQEVRARQLVSRYRSAHQLPAAEPTSTAAA